ncbi:hypothetical protein ABT001_31980 [Streptomyces sp. NPDC002793]|uniref:hypothetical protein n=1 Tax=Streptomyces sp. NPDC002793 TaxID=3154432 RepID=UPI003318CBFA
MLVAGVGFVGRPLEFPEGAEGVGEFQQLAELTPGFAEVADHPVLAAAYLAVLLAQSGDAYLDGLHDLQAALGDLCVQGGQPDRLVLKPGNRRQQGPYRLQFLHNAGWEVCWCSVRRLAWCVAGLLSALWQRESLFDEQGLLHVRGMIARG